MSAAKIDSITFDSMTVFGSISGTAGGAGVIAREGAEDPLREEKRDVKNPPPPGAGFGGSFFGCGFALSRAYRLSAQRCNPTRQGDGGIGWMV